MVWYEPCVIKMKTFFYIAFAFVLGLSPGRAEEAPSLSYYEEVVPSSNKSLTPERLLELEQAAFTRPDSAEVFYPLARAFATTSERVWAVTYGEIFCNLTTDPKRFFEISDTLGEMFEKSLIYKSETEATISFMKVAGVDPDSKEIPFEMNFEISIGYGFNDYERFRNLSIATIHEIRLGQLRVWEEKDLPDHALIAWLRNLHSADMIEAYTYWLFQKFRPDEFAYWRSRNTDKLSAFLEWRRKNAIDLSGANYHRLH